MCQAFAKCLAYSSVASFFSLLCTFVIPACCKRESRENQAYGCPINTFPEGAPKEQARQGMTNCAKFAVFKKVHGNEPQQIETGSDTSYGRKGAI
jgi:hypothetical protein